MPDPPSHHDGPEDPVGSDTPTESVPSSLAFTEVPGPSPYAIDSYRIIEEIGRGGFGIVYKVEQREPVRRIAALKTLIPGVDTREVLVRFEAERQALALMEHPGIARVYDAGKTDRGHPYFVMEYVPGIPITQHCEKHHLTTRDRLGLFLEVCQAVQHAHQKGVVHRDIKPSNVLVAHIDNKPHVKVIDFGVAKAIHQPLTMQTIFTLQGQLIGTPEYMSPEQADRDVGDIDTRTDVYSLGVLLYELLTGSPPFDPTRLRAAGLAEILRIIREEEPEKPSTRLSHVDDLAGTTSRSQVRTVRGDLDWITMKAMEKDRNRRYDSASALAEDVERHLRNESITAGAPSLAYRAKKFVRRHHALVGATALILCVLSVATAFSTVMAIRAMRAEADARLEARISNLTAAQSLLREDNAVEAKHILQSMPPTEHDWPWRYLLAEADQSTRRVSDQGNTTSVVVGHESSVVATATRDGSIDLWSTDLEHLVTLGDYVSPEIAFAPRGPYLVVVSADGRLDVWDVTSRTVVRTTRIEGARLRMATWLPDSSAIVFTASSADQESIMLYRIAEERADTIMSGMESTVVTLAVMPDGERMVVALAENTFATVHAMNGDELFRLAGHDDDITDIEIAPDGSWIVTATYRGSVRRWNAENGALLGPPVEVRGGWLVRAVDPSRLLVGSRDGTVTLMNVESGEVVDRFRGHSDQVIAAATAEGSRFYTASPNGEVLRFDGPRPSSRWPSQDTTATIPAPDDAAVIVCLEDGRIGHLSDGSFMVDSVEPRATTHLAMSDDGGTTARKVRPNRYVIQRGGTTLIDEPYDGLMQIALDPAGDHAVAARRQSVTVHPLPDATTTGPVDIGFIVLALDVRGGRIAAGGVALDPSSGDNVSVLDIDTLETLWSTGVGTAQVAEIRLLPGGRVLTGHGNGEVRLWDRARPGSPRWTLDVAASSIKSLDMRDGTILAGAMDGTISIIDEVQARRILTLQSDFPPVEEAFFIHGGDVIAARDGGGVRYWSAPP